jgi:hypothetical protein
MLIKNAKTLKPNEEIIKTLLEELIRLEVNLTKIKGAQRQRQTVINIIKILQNPKKNFSFQDLFNVLLFLVRTSKTKESIAISAKLYNLVQTAYKGILKEKH